MGKHEIKVPKSNYIIGMTLAILISFGLGLSLGVFYVRYQFENDYASSYNIKTRNEDTSLKPDEFNSIDAVKVSLESYYKVDISTFEALKSQSLAESIQKKVSQDSVFKEKLVKLYENILAKGQYESMKDYISKGTLTTSYYDNLFNSQKDANLGSIIIKEEKNDEVSAKVSVSNSFEYGGKYSIPSSNDFFSKYKAKGITKSQYDKLIGLKPDKIKVKENKEVVVKIENINGKWLITSYSEILESTNIDNLLYKNKIYTLNDFIKYYLK